nr:MAG TPA: hypothetical protein [Bacteriophage sp.]
MVNFLLTNIKSMLSYKTDKKQFIKNLRKCIR